LYAGGPRYDDEYVDGGDDGRFRDEHYDTTAGDGFDARGDDDADCHDERGEFDEQ
jgi:hypothetical protein